MYLPSATRSGTSTSFWDAFFTATSATCVTGLICFDTYTYWSVFGQVVILILIQLGGIGFMTVTLYMIALTKHKIGLVPRFVMQNSISAPQVGGIVRMAKFVLFGTLFVEFLGAILLSFRFCPELGIAKGIWFSVFHSISAFCNAGFDLMGITKEYASLTSYSGDWYLNLIVMALIIIGGLGFFVWKDLVESCFSFRRLKLHTKLAVTITLFLIISGSAALFLFEYHTDAFKNVPLGQQILQSFFQSVTARTAGFNTIDLQAMTQSGQFVIICLMLIGGSPGSTAGGIKTTTFAVLMLSIFSTMKRKKTLEIFGRRLDDAALRTATCVFMLYLTLTLISTAVIASIEPMPLLAALFETSSAIATVGLSFGFTPELSVISHIILAFLMIFGRVGSITMILAITSEKVPLCSKLPTEKIQIG